MILPFYESFIKILDERIESIGSPVLNGAAQSFEQYCSLCGEIRGINASKELLKELMKNYMSPNYLSESDNSF